MMFVILILYFIVAYSISFLFVQSMGPFNIIDKFRNWLGNIHETFEELLDCMYCFPSWVGIGLSLINQFLLPQVTFTPFYLLFGGMCPWYVIVVLDMFVTSGVVYIIDSIIKRILDEID